MNKTFTHNQQGAALMAMVLVIFISASTLLFSAVRPPTSIDEFDSRTFHELQAAKAALIAFATNYAAHNSDGLGPGRLPCPDAFLTGEPYWNGCNWKYVLRLPEYVPLATGYDFPLNDYYADRDLQFWYAISRPYRWYKDSGGNWPEVNSSTGTELTIDGDPYVAVLIAAGPALAGQDRDATENFGNYYGATENLEGTNDNWGWGTFQSSDPADPENFNDLVIGITQSELMSPVTNMVAIEIKRLLDAYHPTNGDSYPTDGVQFAAAIAGIPAWYTGDEWDLVTTFNFVTSNQTIIDDPTRLGDFATLEFQDCNIVYTLDFLSGISRGDPARC